MSKIYNPGKIKPLIKTIANIVEKEIDICMQNDTKICVDYGKLMEKIFVEIPELKDETHCANCGASMSQYEYNLNVVDMALIIGMAKKIRKATKAGKNFTDANIIHVPTLPVSDAVRHRTSRCAKLGLIAKYRKDGQQEKGMWVITRRGFAALRGEEVPTGIIVWRGQTIERKENVTTFTNEVSNYIIKVEKYIKKHNERPEDSHCADAIKYNQNEWVDFAGYHGGKLF